ncbi:SsrA-binding protein SmpB [Aciditerrimonas ferrireducens]|uniref:SsrA-binding protein n=1 Tax=Aciditerrimonas ferrireducens TaxID=667306 RepID=A0ABV6C5R7_9ACTN|nr:SsrA-binding protein SmpB [Aciditerrimonas ferrireducens]MCK4178192.1 SsrA-binding protein SmpB [Aciditerrimonas ferrireducens]
MAAGRAKGSKRSATGHGSDGLRTVARNRRARHDYDILETLECGIQLRGSEVKSLRAGRASLQDAYARVEDGELWLLGAHIPPYDHASGFGTHDPDRRRKLLAHRQEIDELLGRTQQQSLTLVPLAIYFRDGRAKVELALARGRRLYDKRRAIAARDAEREAAREMARAASWSAGRASHRYDGA